jgi:hypothetical protein
LLEDAARRGVEDALDLEVGLRREWRRHVLGVDLKGGIHAHSLESAGMRMYDSFTRQVRRSAHLGLPR